MKTTYFLVLICFLFNSQALLCAERLSLLGLKSGPSYQENKLEPMPDSIANVSHLRIFATHYLKDSSFCSENLEPVAYFYFSRLSGAEERIWEFFDGMKGFHCPSITKSITQRTIIIPLMKNARLSSKILAMKYSNFLLESAKLESLDLTRFQRFGESLNELLEDTKKYQGAIAELSCTKMRTIFKLKLFNTQQKSKLMDTINATMSELKRLVYLFNYYANEPSTNILDLYLLAEHSLNLVRTIEVSLVKNINHEILGDPVNYNIEKFLAHKDFPLRKLYLVIQTAAVHLFSAANELRERAGLPPIPPTEMGDPAFAKTYLKLDLRLGCLESIKSPSIRASEKKQLSPKVPTATNKFEVAPHTAQPSDTERLSQDEAPNSSIAALVECAEEYETYEYEHIDWHGAGEKDSVASLAPTKKSLGETVFSMLNSKHAQVFLSLFELKDRMLTQHELNVMVKQVAFALIDLGQVHIANELLSKAPHFYHPKEGKAGALPHIYLQYRLIPFILSDILPPGFSKDEVIQNSKILRRHHGI